MTGEDKPIRQEVVDEWVQRLSIENKRTARHFLDLAKVVEECACIVQEQEFAAIKDKVATQFGGKGNVSKYRKIAAATWLEEDIEILPRGFSPIYYLAKLSRESYDKAKSTGKVTPDTTRDDIINWTKKNDPATLKKKERARRGIYVRRENASEFRLEIQILCNDRAAFDGTKNKFTTFVAASRLKEVGELARKPNSAFSEATHTDQSQMPEARSASTNPTQPQTEASDTIAEVPSQKAA